MNQINEVDNKIQCIVHEFRNDKDWVNFKRSVVRAPQILKQKVNIGHQLPADEKFDSMCSRFQSTEERIVFLETEVIRFIGYVKSYIHHSIAIGESVAEVFNPNIVLIGREGNDSLASKTLRSNIEEDYTRFTMAKRFVEQGMKNKSQICSNLDLITTNVHIPLARLVGIIKCIKRYFKEREFALLDLNKYYNDFEFLNSKEKSTLTLKQQQNLIRYEKNYELSKLKFEQINDTLNKDLLIFFKLVGEFIQPLHVLFYYLQLTINYQFLKNVSELSDTKLKPDMNNKGLKSFLDSLIEDFHSHYTPVKRNLDHLAITSLKINPTGATGANALVGHEEQMNDVQTTDIESSIVVNEFCTARYNYEAEQNGDLSFNKGDRIKILDQKLNEWWKGELKGQIGLFPHNYVQVEKN